MGCVASAVLAAMVAGPALAQDKGGNDVQRLQAIEVTGSRIKKTEVETQTPVLTLSSKDIQATGLTSIGDIIQQLSISGSSLNTKLNSAGNFGFAPDGSGVGSGSSTISLRNLNAKRTLVLVDGMRWVNETSASGVSAAVDLNTLPASIVERIEILTDGASALYGSDAIAGVINIITKKKQDGAQVSAYYGHYQVGGGDTWSGNASFGASGDRFDVFMDVSHYKQNSISSGDWFQSSFPVPGTGVDNGSSATPNGRFVFDAPSTFGGLCPNNFCNISGNGTGGANPGIGDFHPWSNADRFNFAPYNMLLTPSERTGLFAQSTYRLTDNVNWTVKGLYNTRKSVNQAAPEPIFLGSEAGNGNLGDVTSIDVTNPFNPFGFTLDAEGLLVGRRPLEGGPRIYSQTVDTYYFATGLNGNFDVAERTFYWDVNYVNSSNKATQTVKGTYNLAHIARAVGPLAGCTAPCVPLNLFGGPGSITPEMLQYILFNEKDHSQNDLDMFTANISGDMFQLPAGPLAFAAGLEYRDLSGSYEPDSVIVAGESNGVPSLPISGSYDVKEAYLELNAPLLADVPFARHLDLSVASRYSDYSTFGSTTNNKFGLRWQVVDDLTLRGTWAEGFRAPSIGELFGSPARFDATLQDPCLMQPVGGGNAPATGNPANCAALGVPPDTAQSNTQIAVRTGGNPRLMPETAKSTTLGAIYSPSWADHTDWSDKLDFEFTYYRITLKQAIQAADAQTLLDRCVATLDPVYCQYISRSAGGQINRFENFLQNLGRIDTSGFDFGVSWVGPEFSFGRFGASWQSTYTKHYRSVATDTGQAEPLMVGIEVADHSIPRIRSTARLNWAYGDWNAAFTMRYMSGLTESCAGAEGYPICRFPATNTNRLGATTFNDVRVGWKVPMALDLNVAAGINNVFGKEPPICLSCSLNGYDASSYDLPGRFGYLEANLRF